MHFLFDLDHTLCEDHRLEEAVLQDLVQKHFSLGLSAEELMVSFEEFRLGRMSLPEAVRRGLADWGHPDFNAALFLEEFQKETLRRAPKTVTAVPGARALYEKLRLKGIPFAAFSNGWTLFQEAKGKAIGFPATIVTSEQIGAWKPDPAAFHKALSMLSFPREGTLYAGDSPELDVAGAKSAGLGSIWVNFSGQPFPSHLVPPDFTVTSLEEISHLFLL